METTRGVVVALALALAASAQSGKRLAVRCVDQKGRPVAAAEIWLWQARQMPDGRADLVASGPFRSGDDGMAKTAVATTYAGGHYDRWVYARVAGKLVGANRKAAYATAPVGDTIEVAMLPSRECRGRVTVPDGFDASKVTVRTLRLNGARHNGWWMQPFPRQSNIAGLRDTLPEVFDAKVAADGTFVLRDMPRHGLLYLAAEGEGLGQAQWCNESTGGHRIPSSIPFEMDRESVVRGVVRAPDGRPIRGAEVQIRCLDPSVQMTWTTKSDEAGTYRLGGLTEGQHQLEVATDAGVMRPRTIMLARRAADAQDLEIEKGVVVRGRVTDARGKPVKGVGIRAMDPKGGRTRVYLGNAQTGPQGRFEMRLPRGAAGLYYNLLPEGFVYPQPQVVAEVEVTEGGAGLQGIELRVVRSK